MQNQTQTAAPELATGSAPMAHAPLANTCRILHFDGRDWKVREEPNRYRDGSPDYSLIFESPSLIRRVRCYPTDWFNLADDELFRVSLGT